VRVRFIVITVVTLCFAANVSALPARQIRFDEGNGFETGGAIWAPVQSTLVNPIVNPIDLSVFPDFEALDNDPAEDPIVFPSDLVGFSVNYGNGLQSKVNILPDGYISFGDTAVPAIDPATLGLADNVAAPFLNVLTPSRITYAKGLVIPDFVFGDTASLDDAVKAFRVTWFVPSVDASDSPADFAFQVVLLDRSKVAEGDFDMEFNYEDFSGAVAPLEAFLTAGFHLGPNVVVADWPFNQTGSEVFQFHLGQLVTSPTTTVPEPNSLPLLLAGLSLLAVGLYRRRVAVQPVR
jgi:hypothetical protein